ncbi:MAG: Crp/Fnr family transcriptional regulator [Thermonemataceae bacterium]
MADFTSEEIEAIVSTGTLKKVAAKTKVFQADKPFTKLWFLQEGLVRAYRIVNGQDFTFFFFTKQEFAVDYQSFLTEETSTLLFDTLADTTYWEFSKSAILKLYKNYPRFERVGRIMAEEAYLSATERLKEFQTASLEERYKKLLSKDPELFQQIPQYHIASYLGVKPQSLSRLRAKLTGKRY